ncbi:hypothetical protein [Streptomyces purpureus]|uniref:Uncharacterized protein n=1 Tax=Streptomyces purpureus TaxID=1951 RepID=A0A918LQ02_9ACTN|nr:hypothetical protein [Streptomyces purpureus]GGT32152.1 hypothetical protein GCM10014713_27250 [Streptomyces purpureus]
MVAVGLAVLVLRPDLIPGREGLAPEPLAAETARPSQAPPEEVIPDRPTLKEPFKGSPAAAWADGAAGIQAPPAKAVGWMSKAQVADALRTVKTFLVAANIDPVTVKGGRPTAALELLDPEQPDVLSVMEKALVTPTEEKDPTLLFSRFDPAEVRPVGQVVKTRGRMTVEKGERAGEVLVHTDYTFVYPLVKTRPGADEVARTIVRREITFALPDPARYVVTKGSLSVVAWSSNAGNSACDRPAAGFFRPEFTEDLVADPDPGSEGQVVDPYDRSKSLAALPQECATSSRT